MPNEKVAVVTGGAGAIVLTASVVVLLTLSGLLQRRAMRMLQQGLPTPEIPAAVAPMLGILPFIAIIPALIVPFGAAIYLAISSLWSAIERPGLRRVLWGEAEWRPGVGDE